MADYQNSNGDLKTIIQLHNEDHKGIARKRNLNWAKTNEKQRISEK